MKKVSYQRQNANLQSCLSKLFGVDEVKVQEDFLQISELVNTENHFMSRSTTNYLPSENQTTLDPEQFFTEYLGGLAFLSEKFSAFDIFILDQYHSLVFDADHSRPLDIDTHFLTIAEKMGVWILGASYNYTLRIDAKNDLKCGAHSCYEETLKNGKICKPGIFFMLCYKRYQ